MSVQLLRISKANWWLLKHVADGWSPPPDQSVAIVAAKDDRIVGRILLVAPAHVEGIWIDDRERGGRVMKALVDKIENEAKKQGISTVFAYAVDSQMEDYISRLGYEKQPWTVWRKNLCR